MQIEGPLQVARRSDMDMNGHINNVTYLGWALETVPPDVYLNYSLHEVWPLLFLRRERFVIFIPSCEHDI